MLLVPLLVGIAVLVVVVSSRTDVLKTEINWLESLDHPDAPSSMSCQGIRQPAGTVRSPLLEAFPQLTLWIPAHDAIYRKTYCTAGTAGPDIVIHPFTDAA